MLLELSRGIFIVEKKGQKEDFDRRVKSSVKERQRLRITGIRYIPTPDAAERISRAVDILLRSAVGELERNINAKKEGKTTSK